MSTIGGLVGIWYSIRICNGQITAKRAYDGFVASEAN